MTRALASFSLLALGGVALAGGGCSSNSVPIGQDASSNGDSGNAACGSTTCQQGALCCEGADIDCTPTCMQVTKCPLLGRPCRVPGDGGPPVDAAPSSDASPDVDAERANLKWYSTCGDPVCQAPDGDAGTTDADGGACPVLGSSCSSMGQTCGTRNRAVACGSIEVCDSHDPKAGLGGCPISSRKFKDDIEYLDEGQLEQLHDQTLRMHLATYNYKGQYADPHPKHLGFIIEDNPESLAVSRGRDQVDIYGYLSMVVATMQVQEKEISALKRQLAEARQGAPVRRVK